MTTLGAFAVFKLQAHSFGFALLLSGPLLALLAFVSTLPLTNWTHPGAPPQYDADIWSAAILFLICSGFVMFYCANIAGYDASITQYGGIVALHVVLPVVLLANVPVIILLWIVIPNALGVDGHFYSLDMVGFALGFFLSLVLGKTIMTRLNYWNLERVAINTHSAGGVPAVGGQSDFSSVAFQISMMTVIFTCKSSHACSVSTLSQLGPF